MGVDRFITWGVKPEWGRPTIKRVAQVAQEFLGPTWDVRITDKKCWIVCECKDNPTFHLRSEYVRNGDAHAMAYVRAHDEIYAESTRGFEICFLGRHGQKQTSIITRQTDRFTSALANELTRILAQWWHGTIGWPS